MATSSRGGQAGTGGADWLEKARAQLRKLTRYWPES